MAEHPKTYCRLKDDAMRYFIFTKGNSMNKWFAVMGAFLLVALVSAPTLAQTEVTFAQTAVTCQESYTVTAGDWLSKLADKFYGDPQAYPAIATQTNLKSETDFSYATIVNPDSIEVGWKLCIPNQETANALNGVNAPAGLDKTALANATYTAVMMPDDSYTLTSGKFSEPSVPDSPLMTEVMLTDEIAYGELNGVPSAAVILGATGGGSGYFYSLHIMQNQNGKATEVATTGLGDRSPVIALQVQDNQTLVDMITQGPDQPMCCGNLRVLNWFALDGKELKLANQKALGNLGPNGETPGQPLYVTGDVIYRERIAMPEGAVVKVQVADVSKQDAPADVIGEQVIENPGNVPVKFSVSYDASKIQPQATYAVSARIEVNGKLEWISTTRIPVITNGAPTSGVTVLVQRVGDSANTASSDDAAKKLMSGVWAWQGSTYKDGTKSTPSNPSQYTAQFNPDGNVGVKADCNAGGGPYQVDGNKLTIGNMISTLALCPEGSLGGEFMRDLQNAATFAFDGDNLVITMKDDDGTMTFAPAKKAINALTGITWEWQVTGDKRVNDPSRYTIMFNTHGTANIKNDCNNILADYKVDGSNMTLELGPSTLVACPEDTLDSEFRAQLSAVTSFEIGNGIMLLTLGDGSLMTFGQGKESTGETGAIGQKLFGLWKWQGTTTPKEEIKPDDPNKYTVNFKEDGFVEIKADCNTGSAAYGLGGANELHIGPIALTRAFCGEQSKDTVFVQQFQNSAIYFFKGVDLSIDLTADAGTMHFAR